LTLIPPFFLDAVVAIDDWVASGFLYARYQNTNEKGKSYRTYLVTNRHVFDSLKIAFLRFNPIGGNPAREFIAPLFGNDGNQLWFAHPDPEIDVAVLGVNTTALEREGIQFGLFTSDELAATTERLRDLEVTEGDFIYVLGFPLGLVGTTRNMVIVRAGAIARIRDAIARVTKDFLVDASVFPGNSGGPVILKPEIMSIQGTKSPEAAYLIGIVRGYIPYREEAVSRQTGKTRITFEENSGLAAVIPVDYIDETIDEHVKYVNSAVAAIESSKHAGTPAVQGSS
jgi:hypothetical protein